MEVRYCFLSLLLVLAAAAEAQTVCATPKMFEPCDMVFELPESEAANHPNPYLSVQLHAEIRSPRHRTMLMPAFWDGGRRFIIRFAPTDAGDWDLRTTSNVPAFDGKVGRITVGESEDLGFIRPDNVHHWSYTRTRKPHLWMGDTCYRLAWLDEALVRQIAAKRAEQKFNHMRALVMSNDERLRKAYHGPDQPNPEHFQELDRRIRHLNEKGIFVDLILAGDQNHLAEVFPTWQQRERYVRYVAARYSAMKITWQLAQEFEEYKNPRELFKEVGLALKKHDPYGHPRTVHTVATSAPLLADEWMNYIVYQSSDVALGAVERQIYTVPFVNAEFGYEDSGAGKSHSHHVDPDEFRKRLWRVTMNGNYPTFGNTGTYGGRAFEVDAKYLDSPGAQAMTAWFDFFQRTRFWELQPFFEVDGGRALALTGIEYIVYLETPGPVEVITEKQKYDVYWFRPATGELIAEKKDYKGERFSGQPPDNASDWVLHLSRDGRKQSMLRSWKFESRRVLMQDVEQNPQRVPYEVVEPAGDVLKAGEPLRFAAKITRETRATSNMLFLWTVEATTASQGYRVLGSGIETTARVPAGVAAELPAVLNLRLYGLNANGKLYALDRVMRLTR